LYEDELADNGLAAMSVKCRVMPSCFFVLLRYWLRIGRRNSRGMWCVWKGPERVRERDVHRSIDRPDTTDHVQFTVFETRYFHKFGTDRVLREWVHREEPFQDALMRLPAKDRASKHQDVNLMCTLIHEVERYVERIPVPIVSNMYAGLPTATDADATLVTPGST
jgi:type 2A phosphatase activator TIP41